MSTLPQRRRGELRVSGHPGQSRVRCDLCGEAMISRGSGWTFWCRACGVWQSTLEPAIEAVDHTLEETDRATALEHIRHENFAAILRHLEDHLDFTGARLLDVGCAYGWFLTAAAERGLVGVGIEPDAYTAAAARSRGLSVRHGYFPECVRAGERFDVVVFNDVLEHIPDVQRIVAACARVVAPGGLLVLSVPTSAGTLFRLARVLSALRVRGPWNRMWQRGFPSPHRYYFDRPNLDAVLRRHGFSRVLAEGSTALHRRGLWARVRFDRSSSAAANLLLYVGLLLLYPVYRALGRSDTDLLIYRYDEVRGNARECDLQHG